MNEVLTIKNNDQAYLDFREKYPEGYVLNVYYSGKWITLHKANCGRLNRQRTFEEGTFTGKLAFKICGLSREAVLKEAKEQGISCRLIHGCVK